MSQQVEHQKIRAKQVGILMRHYRLSFAAGDGVTGLTLEGVLERMARVNRRYENSAPSTVSRWESGQTMPRKRRLHEFGRALNLSQAEIDGLLALAGLPDESPPDPAGAHVAPGEDFDRVPASSSGSGPLPPVGGGIYGGANARSLLAENLKRSVFQFLLPGLAIAGAGHLLSSLGITETWTLMLYVGTAMGLVIFQGVLRIRRADSLRDLLFVSLFVVLSAPLMAVPFVHIDHFGFYMLGDPADSAKNLLLALATCLSLALIASVAFDLLWGWQYSGRGAKKAHHRAIWVVAPPVAFVYLSLILIAPLGAWIEYLFVLSVLAGAFITLVLLRDPTVKVSHWDRRFLLWSVFMTVLVLTVIGSVSVLVCYLEFSLLSTKGHTLIHSWEMDYSAWGYSEEELLDRNRVGFVWNGMLILVYMVIVIGGTLLATVLRLDATDTGTPTADIGELAAGSNTYRRSRTQRIKTLFGPRKLAGTPIHSPAG